MESRRYLSLRTHLILVLILVSLLAFTGLWLGTSHFVKRAVIQSAAGDALTVAKITASRIDGQTYMELARHGEMDDQTYTEIADWLRTIKRNQPLASGIYTYRQDPDDPDGIRWVVSAALPNGAPPVSTPGCTLQQGRPILGAHYSVPGGRNTPFMRGLQEPAASEEVLTDEWGRWVSAYAPIYNSQTGEPVGAVGVDVCAQMIADIDQSLRMYVAIGLGATLILLISAAVVISYRITRPILGLTTRANAIAGGDYTTPADSYAPWLNNEVTMLAQVFDMMVGKVRSREDRLKQQVSQLQIVVDESKRRQEVAQITDTDFFRDLERRAEDLRKRRQRE